ncbi:MAG: serine/threonine protein kinase [Planctomycetaceae bacterium]|nr:serine/threonine protein kinase [Planctomycetaceae bacterium]
MFTDQRSSFPADESDLASDAPRELRIGLAALDLRLIDRATLLTSLSAWRDHPHKTLGQVLVERGYLSAKHEELLEALVDSIENANLRESRPVARPAAPPLADVSASRHESKTPSDSPDDSRTQAFLPDAGDELSGLRHVSRLTRERLFAEGGLGQIWLCVQHELLTRRRVAVKQLKPHLADDQQRREQFEFEANVTCSLEHPNIVPVYGLGRTDDGRPYYVMQFIHGELLRDRITEYHNADRHVSDRSERDVELRKLLQQFVNVCDTIHYAHSRGILHRDIKPENVKIGKYGQVMVLDWGLALPFDPRRHDISSDEPSVGAERPRPLAGAEEGRFIGTPGYTSPEQALGKLGALGPRSDVYSLGAVLYCLLTGAPPITADSTEEAIAKAQRGEFPRPRELDPRIPRPLEAICLRAMMFTSEKRYASARALASDIEHWLADAPVTALADSTLNRILWFARHHKPATIAVASVLGVAVLASLLLSQSLQRIMHERDGRQQAFMAIEEALFPADSAQRLNENLNPSLRLQQKYESIVDRDFHEETQDLNLARVPAKIARLPHPFEQTMGLLNQAERQYRKLIEASANDQNLQGEYAMLLINRGIALRDARRYDSSRADLNSAVDQLKTLTARYPEPRFEQMLAQAYHELATLMTFEGNRSQLAAAEDLYLQSRRIRQELVARYRGDLGVEYRHDLAMSDGWLGDLYLSLCQFKEARQRYDDSLKLREELHSERPNNWERSFQLARAYNNFVNVYAEYGDPERPENDPEQLRMALDYSERARRLQTVIVGENPANIDYRVDLGGTHNSAADILIDLGQHDNAAPLAFGAQQIFTELVAHDPNNPRFHSALAETHVILAKYYREAKNESQVTTALAAAEASLQEVMRERRDDGTSVENTNRKNDSDFLTAALIHALRAEVLTGDARSAEIKLAIAQLQEREQRGEQGPRRLQRDRGFKTLHGEPQFKQLITELQGHWKAK